VACGLHPPKPACARRPRRVAPEAARPVASPGR